MPVWDAEALRKAVRALIQNVPANVLLDSNLDEYIVMGKRRLDADAPREITASVSATNAAYYDLSSVLSGWEDGFSIVRSIISPAPDTTAAGVLSEPVYADPRDYRVLSVNGNQWLSFIADEAFMVEYTTRWAVKDVEGASATTVPISRQSALTYIVTALTCFSLATKSAGSLDQQLPGADFINFRSKEQEYRRVAKEWESKYLSELGLDANKPVAVIVRADYDASLTSGSPYLTHGNR